MPERVLVTGADGFVGRHLVPVLRDEGYQVDTHTSAGGDIAHCELAVADVEYVIHLAARTFVPDSWSAPLGFYETNVLGAVNVLEFCRRRKASLVLVSSYVYGRPQWLPIGEDHPIQPFNPYAHSKILAEEVARFYSAQFGVNVATIRPFNIYGPGQSGRFLIPELVRQSLDPGTDRITVSDLRPKRDHLHVRDLVRLLVLAMRNRRPGVYNAGSGRSTSIPEIVELIHRRAPRLKPLLSTGQIRKDEVLDTVADCSKGERELGWVPDIALADGIGELVAAGGSQS